MPTRIRLMYATALVTALALLGAHTHARMSAPGPASAAAGMATPVR